MSLDHVCSIAALIAAVVLAPAAQARDETLSPEDRILITRELTAEYASAKVLIPRSKQPLTIDTEGNTDEWTWVEAQNKWGPAAKVGELVQITKVEFDRKRIVLTLNGGFGGGRKWWQKIQISTGGGMGPVSQPRVPGDAPMGSGRTKLAVEFPEAVPTLDADQIRAYLAPLVDFEQRTASEQYFDTLPEPVQAAIKEERAVEGMDRDMVLLALGTPWRKVRETKDGVESEDWIYGQPPGKVTFVTFQGDKVVQIREMYAGVGGTVAPPLEPTR